MTPIESALRIISLYKSEIVRKMEETGKDAVGVKSVMTIFDDLEEVLRK